MITFAAAALTGLLSSRLPYNRREGFVCSDKCYEVMIRCNKLKDYVKQTTD